MTSCGRGRTIRTLPVEFDDEVRAEAGRRLLRIAPRVAHDPGLADQVVARLMRLSMNPQGGLIPLDERRKVARERRRHQVVPVTC